jgi:hypothetical protein
MSTPFQSKFRNAQLLLKRISLFTFITITPALSLMNAPVQAQTTKAEQLAEKPTVTVVKESTVIPNGEEADLGATCPINTIAIGGGGEVSPNGILNAYLTASSPVLSGTTPTGWHIIGSNFSGSNLTFSAFAICAQLQNK